MFFFLFFYFFFFSRFTDPPVMHTSLHLLFISELSWASNFRYEVKLKKKKTSVLSADVCSITADRRCFKTTLRLFQQQIDVVFLLHLSDNRYEQKFDAVWLEHTPRQGQKHSLLLLCRCVSTAAVTWRISVTNEWNPLNELSTSKTVKHVQ